MIKNFLRAHHYKIALGAPIIFVLIISANSTGLIGTGNVFRLNAENNKQFSATGDVLRVALDVRTHEPFNAVGGTITFSPDVLQVDSIERDRSVIDLWVQDPVYPSGAGTITFSGGVLGSETTEGTVFIVNFKALQEGRALLKLEEGEILASDGEGTSIYTGSNALSITVRNKKNPSPDVTGDGKLDLSDLTLVYRKTFQNYDARYDLNADGAVNWSDVKTLLAAI